MLQVVQLLPIIVGIVAFYKYRADPITFYLMFIVSVCGQGFYYNDLLRMGYIFPSDIYLALFVVVVIFAQHGRFRIKVTETTILTIVLALELALGFLSGYKYKDIFTDFKYVLYFFVPYFYGKSIIDNRKKNISCFIVYLFCIAMTLVLNWKEFLTTGIQYVTSSSDEIARTFGIGMGLACGSLCTCLLINYKERFVKRAGILVYYGLHILLLVSAAVSFTRTSWIVYLLVVVLNLIFVHKTKIKNQNDALRAMLSVVLALLIGYIVLAYFMKKNPEIVDAIFYRLSTIGNTTTDTSNTFYARLNNVISDIDVFYSPRILWGYGFGALYRNAYGNYFNSLENSYIYYLWKYGIIAAAYLFYRVFAKLKRLWTQGTKADKTFAVYIFVTMLVSSFSGNMNSVYPLGMVSILMSINYGLIFDSTDVGNEINESCDNNNI